jgi:hypothetical protein
MKSTTENFIGIYEDAFSKEYCDSLVKYFEDLSAAGLTKSRQQDDSELLKLDVDDEQLYAHEIANVSGCGEALNHFNLVFWGQVYPHYSGTFDALKHHASHGNYFFKVQKTNVGGGYHRWHSESTKPQTSSRILAWTLYLNDVEEGGETEFIYYPKRIKPKAGMVVLWPAGFTHTHRGNPPLSNTKYIVTGWIEF